MELPVADSGETGSAISRVAAHLASPTSEAEIAALVHAATRQGKHVRCAGSGHSFTPVVATSGLLLSLQDYQGIVDVDEARKRVTVKAGTKINAVTRHLKALGLSLVNQATSIRRRLPARWPPARTARGRRWATCRRRSSECASCARTARS